MFRASLRERFLPIGQPLTPLNRYFNQTTHEVTTGWVDPQGGFPLESYSGTLQHKSRVLRDRES
jgi:hypothetical protein